MIGILCSKDIEEEYTKRMHLWFNEFSAEQKEPIVIFPINNIDLKAKTVTGNLITEKEVKVVDSSFPSVIFNFSLQKDDAGIKTRKVLEEMEQVELVNYINKFDQWMVMDMLSSFSSTRSHLLPYHIYDKTERNYKPEDEQKYIIMPSRGASLSRVIYAVPDPKSDRVSGSQYFKKGHICDYIDASLCQQRWLFVEIPEIQVRNNHPVVIRVYLQKLRQDKWSVLGRDIFLEAEDKLTDIIEEVDKTALNAIFHVNKFLPSMGHCFIDFILDSNNKPYFLHIGGLDQFFFRQNRSQEFCKNFCRNILKLSRYYKDKQGGV